MNLFAKRSFALAIALMFALLSVPIPAQATDPNSLIADELTAQKLTSPLQAGEFTITANAEKSVTIDENNKVAEDGTSFSQRIKLGGSGNADYRSIHFSLTDITEITVYAMSSSSSSDRILNLYALDGSLIGAMDAPGKNLNMKTFTVSAGDYYLASPDSGVNVYGVILTPTSGFETFILNASSLSPEKITASKEMDGFLLAATAEKAVTIDENSKVAEDGYSFTQRIKLGGSGNAEYRSIHFTVPGNGNVTVYAMSSSSSSDRKLNLHSLDGTFIDDMDAPGKNLNMKTFSVSAGDYYLTSPDSGVNVYGVTVESAGGGKEEVIRLDWAEVEAPVITDIQADGDTLNVIFTLITGTDGSDKAVVTMYNSQGQEIDSILIGKSTDETRTATFKPDASGTYTFQVEAKRNQVDEGKKSESMTKDFSLPLVPPVIRAFNNADGSFTVKWNAIKEAESYQIEYREFGETEYKPATTVTGTEAMVTGLTVGKSYELRIKAIRGNDEAISNAIQKVLKAEQEREWSFTYFGQSSSSSLNKMEMLDPEEFTFRLYSCSIKDDGVTIDKKGGKFTTFHDGISYYYTKVEPTKENFELTATFTIDYINSTPDGQEGFGLLAMDHLGEFGVSSKNHYTNSAGVIATKFEKVIDGTKYTRKDTLGARFISQLTPEVLNSDDSAIAENGKCVKDAFSYAEEDMVKTGESYTLTLKKTNTGYHASIEGSDQEFILYGVDKLLQIDKESLYVGFAVARGCNATVSNVTFITSDPATDPPAEKEPAELVPYCAGVDSPATASEESYQFVYVSDVPGTLIVKDANGKAVIPEAKLKADVDFVETLKLSEGKNDFVIQFTPDANYIPGENQLLESYETVTTNFTVEYRAYAGSKLYVTPDGTKTGSGTKKSPLDIYTATQFARKGQVIELAGGVYNMPEISIIARGNDGAENAHKVLQSADGERAILNFANANGGMQIWGDYWLIKNIDVTETPGNVKGLQIAGDFNIISGVHAYKNGDTGIQISGTSAETMEKWPANNLVLNCTSYDNIDPGQNNADGFAAKITTGEGNVFRGCIAHHNLDDGWDLYAKIESGPIGAVTIDNCVAYSNGTLTNGVGDGDGNGFKLGGDGISVAHQLLNSIAYDNNHDGITSNSNPSVIVENCTAFGNKGNNIDLYGKGDAERNFVVKNVLSIDGAQADNISEMPSLASDNNYFWNGSTSINAAGNQVDATIFVNTDVSVAPTRDENGSILMNGLLELNDKAPAGVGAVLDVTVLEWNETPVVYQDDKKTDATGIYEVKPGDTLIEIAQRLLGNWRDWQWIYELNKDIIKDPDLIIVGQKLKIPEAR